MGASSSFRNLVLLHWFNNDNIANVGDAAGLRGSSTAGSFYLALFTADPFGSGGIGNECTLGGYARVAANRSTGGFTISGTEMSNAAKVSFPVVTSGTETLTHWGICTGSSGDNCSIAGTCSYDSAETGEYTVNERPVFNAGQLTTTF